MNDELEYEREIDKLKGKPLYESAVRSNAKAVVKKEYESGYYR